MPDYATIGGCELIGRPVFRVGLSEFEVVVEMVAAFRGAEEKGVAFAVGKCGTEAVGPGVGFEIGGFVKDNEIETFATEGVRVEAAFDDDG